jgi:NAD(P)-dependent dehydrogenase (short-subunit alcohol dehydrogenase family)
LHYLSKNTLSPSGFRGSLVLVTSLSGYFGSTGNAAYIASKHGAVGLLRASQQKAISLNIRVNSIAPGYTPTYITAGFGNSILEAGLDHNTADTVASAIAHAALDGRRLGTSCLVSSYQALRIDQYH